MTPGSQHRIAVKAPRYGSVSLRSRLHKVELRRNSVLTFSLPLAPEHHSADEKRRDPRVNHLVFGKQYVRHSASSHFATVGSTPFKLRKHNVNHRTLMGAA